jgi:hypothetical protein
MFYVFKFVQVYKLMDVEGMVVFQYEQSLINSLSGLI